MDFYNKTALEIGQMIKNKEVSCVELTKHILDNIKNTEKDINAYTSVIEESALKEAEKIQEKINKGEELSPLAGVPMAIKDNICTKRSKYYLRFKKCLKALFHHITLQW